MMGSSRTKSRPNESYNGSGWSSNLNSDVFSSFSGVAEVSLNLLVWIVEDDSACARMVSIFIEAVGVKGATHKFFGSAFGKATISTGKVNCLVEHAPVVVVLRGARLR